MKAVSLAILTLVLVPAAAMAAAAPSATSSGKFAGKGQLGFLASQGNAQGKSANVALNLSYVIGPWKHMLDLTGIYGQSQSIVSAERWTVLWQTNRSISADTFAFGSLRYEHDMFDGFQYQRSLSGGLGYTVLKSKSITLSTQLGAGYMMSRPELLIRNALGAVVQRIPQLDQNYAIVTAGVDYDQEITSTTTITDKLLVDAGSQNTLLTNQLAFVVKISTKLAMSLGYNIQDNTRPPVGIKSLNSTETVNLVYAF